MPHIIDTSFEAEDPALEPSNMTSFENDPAPTDLDAHSVANQAAHLTSEHTGTSKEEHHGVFSSAFKSITKIFDHHKRNNSFPTIPDLEYYHGEMYSIGGDTLSKTIVSPKAIACASAFEAVRAYERQKNLRQIANDEKGSYNFVSSFAMAESIKLFESHHNRHATTQEKHDIAAEAATYAQYYYNAVYHRERAGKQKAEGWKLERESAPSLEAVAN
jgi:hypothetical protein